MQIESVGADPLGADLSERMDRMMRWLLRDARLAAAPSRTGLSVLAMLGERGPCRITELAIAEHITQPSMTNLVTRLAEEGMVERLPDPDDGRAVLVAITDGGRAMQHRVRAQRAVLLAEAMVDLTDEERETLADALPVLDRLLPTP